MISCNDDILKIRDPCYMKMIGSFNGRNGDGEVDGSGIQCRYGAWCGEGVNLHIDIGKLLAKLFQVGKKIVTHGQFAGTDIDLAALTVDEFLKHATGTVHLLNSTAYLSEKHLAFGSESNTFSRTEEQLALQFLFQILDIFVTVGCVRHRCCAAREIFFALATS